MQYLNFGRKYEAAAVTGDISRLPGKNCLVRQSQMIGTRLFCEEEESMSNFSHSEEESIEILKENPLALDEKLEKAIYSKTKVLYCSTKKSTSFNKIMKQEMQLFDSTEYPSPNIKFCDALKTILPTSVEAERAFSAAGLFVTKLRTRLSDKINWLEYIKLYCRNSNLGHHTGQANAVRGINADQIRCSQLASLDKNNALRVIKLRLSYLQGKSTTMSVIAYQTEKEWNLADEKSKQRMSQTQADCAAQQHAARLEDAHLQAHHSCFTTSERR
ncbi:uncharacterized protein TNCV_2714741 [Trichonephila clavipes]|nr:uncharacterized protein TNCV_2714741 [Trichonephila clavipes]